MSSLKISNPLAANALIVAKKLRSFPTNSTKNIPAKDVNRKSILPSANWMTETDPNWTVLKKSKAKT
jgi:hypothetical protein